MQAAPLRLLTWGRAAGILSILHGPWPRTKRDPEQATQPETTRARGGGLDLRGGAGAAQKAVLGLLGVGADLAPPALAAFATYSDYRSIFQNPLGLI